MAQGTVLSDDIRIDRFELGNRVAGGGLLAPAGVDIGAEHVIRLDERQQQRRHEGGERKDAGARPAANLHGDESL